MTASTFSRRRHFFKILVPNAVGYLNGIIMTEWVPQGLKQQYYFEVLEKFRERVRKKKLDLQNHNMGILHQDNFLGAHCALCKTVLGEQTHYCA
ncbi:hypothetical protein TNCV_3467921 [Trichonephila clavipes]|nr:hypothetical protein TNCV_3467921 [Trichonephila clavipes]